MNRRAVLPGRALATFFILFLLVQSGRAEIKNFGIRGTVDVIRGELPGVPDGTPFKGFYIFDTAAADSNPDETAGDHWHEERPFGIVLQIGDYKFLTDPEQVHFLVEVVNRESDHYLIRSYTNVASHGLQVEHISWQLDDPNGQALGSDELPDTPPDLEDFESVFGLTIRGEGFMIRGHVSEIREIIPGIPEQPATRIYDAVEIAWKSEMGYFYQIQISRDMKRWRNHGEPIEGTGERMSKFLRRLDRSLYYRVVIANHP